MTVISFKRPIPKLNMTQILDIIMSETYAFKYIILKGKVTLRNHSNFSHCFRFKWNARSRRDYHVNDFSYRTVEWHNGEHWVHEGLTSLWKFGNRLSNFWHYTLNQKGPAGFKISAVLAGITMLLLRTRIAVTGDPFVKKSETFCCRRICLLFCVSGVVWMRWLHWKFHSASLSRALNYMLRQNLQSAQEDYTHKCYKQIAIQLSPQYLLQLGSKHPWVVLRSMPCIFLWCFCLTLVKCISRANLISSD